jgi:hypothetical protein
LWDLLNDMDWRMADMKHKLLKLVLIRRLGRPVIRRDSCDYCQFRPGFP